MIHALHRVTDFQVIGPYRLRVSFRDGIVRDIDFQPVLAGSLFGPLRDPEFFNPVRLDPEVPTLVESGRQRALTDRRRGILLHRESDVAGGARHDRAKHLSEARPVGCARARFNASGSVRRLRCRTTLPCSSSTHTYILLAWRSMPQ